MSGLIDKDRLKRYVQIKMEIDNQLERLERMRANEELPAMKESDGSQRSLYKSDRLANAIIKRMEYQDKVEATIAKNMAELDYIETSIDMLDNPMEKEVLRRRYIDGLHCYLTPWNKVALSIYGDDDERHLKATYRLHGHALQSLAKLTEPKEGEI